MCVWGCEALILVPLLQLDLVGARRTGVLSTIGSTNATAGFPLGSVVEYAAGPDGRPIFALSSLSGHTRDLRAEPRCSLTVTAPGFQVPDSLFLWRAEVFRVKRRFLCTWHATTSFAAAV